MKHQAYCYRTIKGERYVCWGDVLGPDDEAAVAACKAHRIPHRLVRVDDFKRLFVRELDTWKLC